MGTQHMLNFVLLMSCFGLHFLISTYISSSLISNTMNFLNVMFPSSQVFITVFITVFIRSKAVRTILNPSRFSQRSPATF